MMMMMMMIKIKNTSIININSFDKKVDDIEVSDDSNESSDQNEEEI